MNSELGTALVAGGFLILGAGISQVGTWLNRKREEDRAVRIATAERLAESYGALIAAAWTMHDRANVGAWTEPLPDDWQTRMSAADRALILLMLEEGTENVLELSRSISKAYHSWIRNKEFLLANGNGNDSKEARAVMENDEATIRSKLRELEQLARQHVGNLRK